MKLTRLTLFVVSLALVSAQAQSGAGLDKIKWNGFMNAIGAASDSNTPYLEDIDDNGSFDETNFGLNATAQVSRRLRIAGQIFLSTEKVEFDWGFADYSFNENINGRVGKIKYPGTLVSETADIGITYPWVRPPESLYSEAADISFEAYTGVGGIFEGGDDIIYSLNIYGGQVNDEVSEDDKLIGAAFTLSNDYGEIKLNISNSEIDAEGELADGESHTIMNAGIHGEWNNIELYSEYARADVDNFSDLDTEVWYATVGYHFGKTMPHLTYQDYSVDTGREQNSWTLGVKQTLTPSAVLKLEVQQVSDIKNGGLFEAQPDDSDVYVFNAAMNFVF